MEKQAKEQVIRKIENMWNKHIIDFKPRNETNQFMVSEGYNVSKMEIPKPAFDKVRERYEHINYDDYLDFLNGFDKGVNEFKLQQNKESKSRNSPVHIELLPIGDMP